MKKKHAKRILGVIGSPRKKGNTHILVSNILDSAKEMGAITETIFLNDLNIRECDGCHVCWKGKPCKKKDDMNDLFPDIIRSNVIVFGTPVYWYGPTALMKCFIDRFVYFNCPGNRPGIRGTAAVLAVPFEEEREDTADLLVRFFEKSLAYLEMHMVAKILVPGVSSKGEILKKADRLDEARAFGRALVTNT
jgi:multimeric flavodoxin WrbA